jgi:hypothetical protein
MQRYHLLKKDIQTAGETIGRTVQNRIPSAAPRNRSPSRCSPWPTSHPSPQTIAFNSRPHTELAALSAFYWPSQQIPVRHIGQTRDMWLGVAEPSST